MNNKFIALIALAVVVIAGWLIYGRSASDVNLESGMTLPVGSGQEEGPAGEAVTVREFTVTGTSFAFAPKTLSVKKGDTVKITFVNAEGFHDLKIDEFNVATSKLAAGKSETVTFVADKEGAFEYYCSVGTHRQMGMVGTLTVTP